MPTEVKIQGFKVAELDEENRKRVLDWYRRVHLIDSGFVSEALDELSGAIVRDLFGEKFTERNRVEWSTNYWWEVSVTVISPDWTAESVQKVAEFSGVTIPKADLLAWSKTDRANWRQGSYLGGVHQPSKCWDEWDDDDCETCEKDRPEMAAALDDLHHDLNYAVAKAMMKALKDRFSDDHVIDEINANEMLFDKDGHYIRQ